MPQEMRGPEGPTATPTDPEREKAEYIIRTPQPDPGLVGAQDAVLEEIDALPTYAPTVGCVIPAYNEESSIGAVLDSLLHQTRMPDVIHVVVNNTTDDTVDVASKYAGFHERWVKGKRFTTEVYIHDIGENRDKKVGALNYGYQLIDGYDYLIGVDGDTVAEPNAVAELLSEIQSDPRIGGISAIFTIDDRDIPSGTMASFLTTGQRAQFGAFNMQNLIHGRNMAVLGGQYSIFSMAALSDVMKKYHQASPWVRDSEVEDSLLSLQIKSAGYLTKISATSRAYVGGMQTLRALDAQQVKWNFGAIDLMWPGQRGDTKGQPFHPNLRLRWIEHLSMVANIFARFIFVFLLITSIGFGAFVFSPIWLIPPVVAILLNVRVAASMESRNARDYAFAWLFFPAEIYLWIRFGHFIRAWTKFFGRGTSDNWAAQARAERGSGNGYLAPFAIAVLVWVAFILVWWLLPSDVQSTTLWIGWTILGVITVIQTVTMTFRLFRSHKGYRA